MVMRDGINAPRPAKGVRLMGGYVCAALIITGLMVLASIITSLAAMDRA